MRNFTNEPVFDDTLPVADGVLEAGAAFRSIAFSRPWKTGFAAKAT